MTINLFDHEELGDIQPLKDILASPIFDGLDLQGQIKYIINENSRLKVMVADLKDELKNWKADSERLAGKYEDDDGYCIHCFRQISYDPDSHDTDCPIELHRALVEKYEVME